MTIKQSLQFGCMIAVAFCCGVFAFRYADISQAEAIIGFLDPRLISLQPSLLETILTVIIPFMIIFMFSTHPIFYGLALLVIALKAVFLGFSSIYIVEVLNRTLLYIEWWFPFQLLYLLLFIFIYTICRIQPRARKRKWVRRMPFVIICIAGVIYCETFVITFLF